VENKKQVCNNDVKMSCHLTAHRSNKIVWQESQTRTGFSDEASGILLSEQVLQKIRPQFRQWCCKKDEIPFQMTNHYDMRRLTFLFDNEN
jgi:hypothetical protein